MQNLAPLTLKYNKKVTPAQLTGTQKDGFFRVLDDDNKSTYMYKRYDKYHPKCNSLLSDHKSPPAILEEARCQTDQMANTGGTPGEARGVPVSVCSPSGRGWPCGPSMTKKTDTI